MTAKLVPAVRTTYAQQDMIRGFTEGWYKQFGTIPKKESIGVLYSQNALETGGTKSMWNNNIGNVKFAPNKNPDLDNGKEYMMLSNVWEIIGGKKVIFNPPDPATWFKSYASLADGIAEHLDYLKNKRYKDAWVAVEAGDPAQFAHILKVHLYYTAPEADYIKGMQGWFKKFMADNTFENVVEELKKLSVSTPNSTSTPPLQIDPTGFFDKIKSLFNK
jgi:hypothetical protein